uniref:centromere protein L-like n=1 Tax=Styela clava TaxID=7725 RepID=UPI00193A2FA7|nr:centromere protein L-like [Styela clava]
MSFKTPHSTVRKRKIQRQSLLDTKKHKRHKKTVITPEIEGIFKGMLYKTWICHSCSPLYNFRTDESSLRHYSQHLSAYLTSEIQKQDCFLSSEFSGGLTAQFSVVQGFAIQQDEPDAIKLHISYDEKKNPIEVYFLSVDVNPLEFSNPTAENIRTIRLLKSGFYFLPIMIYNGYIQKPCSAVISWFEDNFDCVIRPVKFNPIDLSWMMSMWTSFKYIPSSKRKSFLTEFIWKIPVDNIGLDTIKFQIAPSSTTEIWESMKISENDEMTVEYVEKFMSAITSHLKGMSGIKFDSLILEEISTPFIRVQSSGKIKIGSAAHILTVLAHLCCLSSERIYSAVES